MEKIISLSNSKIKLAASLKTAKSRIETRLFIAEGVRLCEEALKAAAAGWEIKFGLFTEEIIATERGKKLADLAAERGVEIFAVGENIYKKAAQTVSSQGVLFVIKQNSGFKTPSLEIRSLIVALDGVSDPGNVGTIMRTAEAIGATEMIATGNTADIYNEKAVRASMGAMFRLPFRKMDVHEFLQEMAENKIKIYATALDKKAKTHFTADFQTDCAIVFGSEGQGVSADILKAVDDGQNGEKIYIPMKGEADSFNVAAASAIILYEAYRQRNL